MRQHFILTGCVVLLFTFLSSTALAQRIGFVQRTLKVPGELIAIGKANLDGDGAENLITAYQRPLKTGPKQRFLGIFFRTHNGLNSAPDLAFQVLADAVMFDVANLNPEPGHELIYLTNTGVWSQSFHGRKAHPTRKLHTVLSLIGEPQEGRLHAWNFVRPHYSKIQLKMDLKTLLLLKPQEA